MSHHTKKKKLGTSDLAKTLGPLQFDFLAPALVVPSTLNNVPEYPLEAKNKDLHNPCNFQLSASQTFLIAEILQKIYDKLNVLATKANALLRPIDFTEKLFQCYLIDLLKPMGLNCT